MGRFERAQLLSDAAFDSARKNGLRRQQRIGG